MKKDESIFVGWWVGFGLVGWWVGDFPKFSKKLEGGWPVLFFSKNLQPTSTHQPTV